MGLAALAAGLAGCGGGDEEQASTAPPAATAPATVPTQPATAPDEPTTPATEPTTPARPPASTTPDDEQGGGSEPARTELDFRGTNAGVKPTHAGVAPYISVKVTLTSADHSSHTLTIDGHTAKVGGTRTSAFFTLPGIGPGKSYTGTVDGRRLTIKSTSEPGP